MPKKPLGINVFKAAQQRIEYVFDNFQRIYVSFSGGKDSTVMLHLVMDEAKKRKIKIGLLIVDLEGQYKLTIDHIREMINIYRNQIELYWIALPIALRNAVSMYDPKWICWEPGKEWIRKQDDLSIVSESYFPFFRRGMEFEDFVPEFGKWYSGGKLTACLVGIRSDESLNRFRTIAGRKSKFNGKCWTTWLGDSLYNAYPIYDWKTSDIWKYNGKFGKSYNKIYDLMHKAGLSIHQQRICQPYGDDQRKGLWLFHVIEPETWSKIVARVNGANSGALYSQESGNILGRLKISKPENHTWESFSKMLLESLPPKSREQFENKISVFIKWWMDRGYSGGIPDESDTNEEASRKVPSWRRICKALLKNDYWCKSLSFSMNKAGAFEKYRKVMIERRRRWGIFSPTQNL
jgi:predicted phosphoadenosine phosphosulfate sulfurtransferase